MPEIDDVRNLRSLRLSRKPGQSDHSAEYQRQAMHRAALSSEFVTQSEHWNFYLQHLQSLQEQDVAIVENLRSRINTLDPISYDELISLMKKLHRVEGKIEARNQAMSLPKLLMDRSSKDSEDSKDSKFNT